MRGAGPARRARGARLAGALVLAGLVLAGPAGRPPTAPAHPRPVEPRFDLDQAWRSPFPSDRLTLPDPAQRTGLRVALPLPDCAVLVSTCVEIGLLNELDGFDLSPRLVLPFTGPIDLASVTPQSVFLVRLATGPPEAIGVGRLVYDPSSNTLYARPDTLLEPETRYGLVVTRALRDAEGVRIRASVPFHRFLGFRAGSPEARGYQRALGALLAALGRRGLARGDVAVASVFTTGSVTTFLEQARDALDRQPPAAAAMTAPEEGGLAFFPRAALGSATYRRHVRVDPASTAGEGAFREERLPIAALPREAVAGIGVGWFWSRSYLSDEGRIDEGPTGSPSRGPRREAPVPFVVVLPAGVPPPHGWPLALFGHGYRGEMFGGAFRLAGTLARFGIATAAVNVVGHGGGPDSELLVQTGEGTRTVRVPGRGRDTDGDGRIEDAEGFGPSAGSPIAALSIRDGLRQQVVDLMAFVRAIRAGLDVDGDGRPDTGTGPLFYVGQSLGGIYGTLFAAVERRVEAAVLNVPGGPIVEVARLSPAFRALVAESLRRRAPALLEDGADFREELPLRGDGPVILSRSSAGVLQDYLARVEWLGRRGDPVAYARYLRTVPLPGRSPVPVLVQLTTGDRVVPNPTTSTFVRAGQLEDATVLVRHDRVPRGNPGRRVEPHGFLLQAGEAGLIGAIGRAAQEQVARFLVSALGESASLWTPPLFAGSEPLFEVPVERLPDVVGFEEASGG